MTLNGFKSITVREKTYTKIEELARKENRSVSNLIDTLVMTNLIREEKAIEIPIEERGFFENGQDVKVTIESI